MKLAKYFPVAPRDSSPNPVFFNSLTKSHEQDFDREIDSDLVMNK